MKDIIIATKNKNKVYELKRLLEPYGIKIHSLLEYENIPEIIEDGKTFEENSLKKAGEIFKLLKTPVIADDSGLVVEQIKGKPGIYSSRYAGENATDEENNKKLLKELANFPEPHFAKFYCAAAFIDGNHSITVTGELKGRIIKSPRGKNGFGYDPLFVPEGFNKTLAEFTIEEKNKISHRSKAFMKLKDILMKKLKIGEE